MNIKSFSDLEGAERVMLDQETELCNWVLNASNRKERIYKPSVQMIAYLMAIKTIATACCLNAEEIVDDLNKAILFNPEVAEQLRAALGVQEKEEE